MKRTIKFIFLSTICFFVLIHKIKAQQMDSLQNKGQQTGIDLYDLSLEQLGKIVITASKTPQSTSKITQKVDVVSSKQISQIISGNRNIAELIQYIPGASVKVLSRNDANWGAYGGIGPKYSTYMLQGLPVDGFIDPMNIDEMAIQRIEIQRGPASVLYPNYLSQDFAGNQSPLAGTINLILKEDVIKPHSTAAFNYGSYNTFSGQLYHENRFGKLHIFGGTSYEKSDYINYGSSNSWLNMLKKPEYQKSKTILGVSLYLDKAEKHKITVFGNQTFHWGDVGRINRDYDNQYSTLNLGYTGLLTDSLKLTFKSGLRSYLRSWQEDNYAVNNDQSLKETDGVKQLIVPTDLSLSYNHFNNSTLTIGSDYQKSFYQTWTQAVNFNEITGNDAVASQIGLYCQEELQLKNLTLRGGGRYNIINYEIKKSGGQIPLAKTQSWKVLLWSTGVKCRISEKWIVFANGGNSFMSPGLKSIGGTLLLADKFVPGKNGQLPNSDLTQESGLGFDIGFEYKLPANIDFLIRAFESRITDAIIDIVISNNPSQTMSVNADGETVAKGFEISLKQQNEKNIDWFANLTITKSEIVYPKDADKNGVEIPFVPEIMGNLGLSFYLPYGIEVSPMLHFGGLIYDSNSKTNRNSYNSGEVVNVITSKKFKFAEDKQFTVYLKFYNITDNKFEMPWQFRDPGFNFTVSTMLNF